MLPSQFGRLFLAHTSYLNLDDLTLTGVFAVRSDMIETLAKARDRGMKIPPLSVTEEHHESKGEHYGSQATKENGENAASQRTLACGVRGHDLRAFHFIVVWRRLDVIEFDRVVAVRLDQSCHE
jgi:hypothetical protein